MNIFCVNLERAVERKQNIKKSWIENLGLDITFWKAYDRDLITQGQFYYQYDSEQSEKVFGRKLNNGEIACCTSFYQLFEYVLSNDLQEVIIMEDDVVPLINHKDMLFNSIKEAKKEFPVQMILMHEVFTGDVTSYNNLLRITPEVYYKEAQYSSLCKTTPWGNLMFYITKQGIVNVLNNIGKKRCSRCPFNITIWFPADYFQKIILCPKKLVSILNNSICKHQTNPSSYIGDQYRFE